MASAASPEATETSSVDSGNSECAEPEHDAFGRQSMRGRHPGVEGPPGPAVDAAGWLRGAERRLSPRRDARSPDAVIDLLVIHNISLPPGEFGGHWIDDLFLACLDPEAHPYFRAIAEAPVSAHLLIRRDGRCIQYVPFGERAWHAGVSSFAGRERCNDYSIGVELEGSDDTPFEPVQYQVLAEATRALMAAYPGIRPDRIVGHSDIAPGRKTDPGPYFDWDRFRPLVA